MNRTILKLLAGFTLRPAAVACAGIAVLAAMTAATPDPARAEVRLVHSPPRSLEAGTSVVIEVVTAGDLSPERVRTADLLVSAPDGWEELPMSVARGALSARIPSALVTPPSFRYYIRVVDDEGQTVFLPPRAPGSGAFVVPVFDLSRVSDSGLVETETSLGVEIISPLPGEVAPDSTPSMAVLVEPKMSRPLEPLALLDGVDVTDRLDVGDDYLVLVPADSLAKGPHSVTLVALTPGRRVEASWRFYVMSTEAPRAEQPPVEGIGPSAEAPFEIRGRIELGWVAVVAETTAVDTAAVFLPFEEVSRPTLDVYASGAVGGAYLLLSAQYEPVYDESPSWSLSAETPRMSAQVGDVYPSLSGTTLDWVVGQGGVFEWRQGRTSTELVAMRMSEADTVGGFGVYSRFALAAREAVGWGSKSSASLIYMYAFDREESVPDTQRIAEALRNSVLAGTVALDFGCSRIRIEAALSEARGAVSGDGTALRAGVEYGEDPLRRVTVEYVTSEPSFHSAGSYEYQPGESGISADYIFGTGGALQSSGSVGLFRTARSDYAAGTDGYEFKLYARADLSNDIPIGSLRSFAAVRYDRIPYESYDYTYYYATGGTTLRSSRARASLSSSMSRSESTDERTVWSGAAEAGYDLAPGVWSVRAGGRLSIASDDGGETEYTRARWTAESSVSLLGVEFTVSYELLDRDDRFDPTGTYSERIFRASIGRVF